MYCPSGSLFDMFRADEGGSSGASFVDLGEHERSSAANVFHHHDINNNAVGLTTSSIYNDMDATNIASTDVGNNNLHSGGLNSDYVLTISQIEEWIVTSGDQRNQERFTVADDSSNKEQSKGKIEDPKAIALRRMAQNREAARRRRAKMKAHVQQLENSRQRLAQLEEQLIKGATTQETFVASEFSRDQSHTIGGGKVAASPFDLDYARWLEEHQQLLNSMRSSLNSQANESELHLLVQGVMLHYDEIFRLKSIGAKSDVFYILSGTWKTPAERCFSWLGGFRCSEILKIIGNQVQPLTQEQIVDIRNLRQSTQESEAALSQGMEVLQNTVLETLSSKTFYDTSSCDFGTTNVDLYMGQMTVAMSKFAALESFLHQADLLRQQTLQRLQCILTTVQTARALLAINDYNSRLRALNS